MAIRIISWNIFNFAAGTSGVMSRTDSTNRMMDVVHPPAGAAECDIFVIIEPTTKKGKVGTAATGGGPSGGTQILAILNARANGGADWAMVAPQIIYCKKKGGGETVLVFHRTPVVTFQAGTLLTNSTKTIIPNWEILGVRESCPFHVTFRDVATNTDFELIAQHAPSPSYGADQNRKANLGVAAVGAHASVTGKPRVVYLGDLNLCAVPSPPVPDCDLTGHNDDRTTLGNLGLTLVSDRTRSSLKSGAAVWNNYREHAYDNILVKGHTAANLPGVIDLVAPLVATKPTPIAANVFRSGTVFHKIRIIKKGGISDHLPIKVTLTF
ncbi:MULTISPECIES: endonuclease/exonuclease/phosphatase family protein [unclassified Pseudomonas]|uniref:endonuclease/exonuclease/phosphatase family protein n=1 Tax=unclassified Pseudomonas TaxID=196821 RepID=UPI000BA41C2A|nr:MULTISPECIES: hypothetical protein [unclassified Pseudomonas]MCU1732678.1 hypothetical protein [Pseudomonas sp. 20P_3.2_Bac4]MCU1744028.1 hypothetical protein [Pseudomonas sp. 20P_3.2_Bac5]